MTFKACGTLEPCADPYGFFSQQHFLLAARSRWEFLLVIAPWRMTGATSSPVNPIAIF